MTNRKIVLQHNQPLRIEGGMDALRVECVGGTVWLTGLERAGDVFLRTGEAMEIHGRGIVLIEALGRGCIVLHRVPPRWRRLFAAAAVVLSSTHEYLRTVRLHWRRNSLAG